jgi:hypothetical protein
MNQEGDANAQPVGVSHTVHSYYHAAALARQMSLDRRLEIINEAMLA